MVFKEIFVWLIIFVVGSLIVSFLIYPTTYDKFKDRLFDLSNFFQKEKNIGVNLTEFEEGSICSYIDSLAEINGINKKTYRKAECSRFCSYEKYLIYNSNYCNEKDKLICRCIK